MSGAGDRRAALAFGYAGLIPFVGLAIAALTGAVWAGPLLLGYGAAILSFLGGVVWGRALAGMRRRGLAVSLGVAVTPALLAWLALWLGGVEGLWLCALALVGLLAYDLREGALPDWFARLRVHLTVGAAGPLVLAAVFG